MSSNRRAALYVASCEHLPLAARRTILDALGLIDEHGQLAPDDQWPTTSSLTAPKGALAGNPAARLRIHPTSRRRHR